MSTDRPYSRISASEFDVKTYSCTAYSYCCIMPVRCHLLIISHVGKSNESNITEQNNRPGWITKIKVFFLEAGSKHSLSEEAEAEHWSGNQVHLKNGPSKGDISGGKIGQHCRRPCLFYQWASWLLATVRIKSEWLAYSCREWSMSVHFTPDTSSPAIHNVSIRNYRSIGTAHTPAKAHLTSAAIWRISMNERPSTIFHISQ